MSLDLASIEAARSRIAPHTRHTPLLPLPALRGDMPPNLRLKLENLQVSGSFKARGAFNHLLQLAPEQRQRGVVAASGGNHGVAVAYAASRLGLPATIYLPEQASADRVARIAAWGAQVVPYGRNWDDAHQQAMAHAQAQGSPYIHPFDAQRTLEGTGTLGLELLDDLPELDCVVVAIGGGGLISGLSAAIKQLRPHVRIIGVEPVGAASMSAALQAGRVRELPATHTIADTLAPRAVSERTLALTRQYVDEVVLVEDAQMVAGMRWLWAEANQLVEPAGAAVVAAIQAGLDLAAYHAPVALICGGNAAAEPVFTSYQR
ncbi:pyridoxal-phosphate dependent enzyme [Chloroflexia bacterium SDU3-3]|nr:pyridoxal-phosphate dependent enzyme [Chloroflexia bacterium SDU3-3]